MSESMTLTLSEFLLARIAEDEADGRHYIAGWGVSRVFDETGDHFTDASGARADSHAEALGRGWLTEKPDARLMAEAKAKRRIVERITDGCPHPPQVGGWCHWCDGTLLDFADIYADHPDYREEWRP